MLPGEDHDLHHEETLGRLVFFVGPSLASEDVNPIELYCDRGILERLWESDIYVWRGIIKHIESEIGKE